MTTHPDTSGDTVSAVPPAADSVEGANGETPESQGNQGVEPGPVAYERFKVVNERMKVAESRIAELEANPVEPQVNGTLPGSAEANLAAMIDERVRQMLPGAQELMVETNVRRQLGNPAMTDVQIAAVTKVQQKYSGMTAQEALALAKLDSPDTFRETGGPETFGSMAPRHRGSSPAREPEPQELPTEVLRNVPTDDGRARSYSPDERRDKIIREWKARGVDQRCHQLMHGLRGLPPQ